MRFAYVLAVAALTFAAPAAAQTVQHVSFTSEFQENLEDDIGEREGEYLRGVVTEAIEGAIARRNAAHTPVRIEVVIVDARPNRVTMQQLRDRPGLDYMRSVSTGGAALRAVLRGGDGAVLTEIEHARYTHSLQDLFIEPTTWSDARRAIRQFAEKVADAYVAQAQ